MKGSTHVRVEPSAFHPSGSFGVHAYVFDTVAHLNRCSLVGSVSAYRDGRHPLRLWADRTLKYQGDLPGHAGEVKILKSLSDGVRLLSGGEDCWIRIWDVEAGIEVAALPTPSAAFRASVSAFGNLIALRCDGGRWTLCRLISPSKQSLPAIAAWWDKSKQLHATCPACAALFGFGESIYDLNPKALGSETACPEGHRMWILTWPLGTVPIWCDEAYLKRFLPSVKVRWT